MDRRLFISTLAALPALGLLAACGSDAESDSVRSSDAVSEEPTDTTNATPTAPASSPETSPQTDVPQTEAPAEPAAPIESASDQAVLSYTAPGGFTTREYAFQDPPIALLTADGTLIGSGVAPDVAPQPLLPSHRMRTVSQAGIDAMLAAAEAAGLFAEVDYTSEDDLLIADAATTLLTITADGTTYTHEAYALGIGGGPGAGGTESTPQRQALLDFLTAIETDPASIFGAENLGEPTDYEPDAYQLIAMSASDDLGGDTVTVPWPADTGIDLAAATECVEIARDALGDLFQQATQQTYFEQDGEIYSVTPRPAYPGRTC